MNYFWRKLFSILHTDSSLWFSHTSILGATKFITINLFQSLPSWAAVAPSISSSPKAPSPPTNPNFPLLITIIATEQQNPFISVCLRHFARSRSAPSRRVQSPIFAQICVPFSSPFFLLFTQFAPFFCFFCFCWLISRKKLPIFLPICLLSFFRREGWFLRFSPNKLIEPE